MGPATRLMLSKIGHDTDGLTLADGASDSSRECIAWYKPGNEAMPSVALPGNLSDTCERGFLYIKTRISSSR
eukprot:5410558-Pyramimonas_sp.AAC.1